VDISRLPHVADFPVDYYAFLLPDDARPHGFIPANVVAQMPWTSDFVLSTTGELPRTVQLLDTSKGTGTAAACNASLARLIDTAQAQGLFPKTLGRKPKGEDYRIMGAMNYQGKNGLIQMQRSASPLFGIANRGSHMTMYVKSKETGEIKIWVPRRSSHLATYPGKLDNTVAGGIRAEESPLECIIHESDEEASLPADFVNKHVKAVGVVTYVTQTGSGGGQDQQVAVGGYDTGLLVPDVIYLYDLEVPADQAETIVPKPGDDEVEQFYLWDVETVKKAIFNGEFKANTAMVLVDFFVRHAIITDDNEVDYTKIVTRLHRPLPVPLWAPLEV
jgi:8-oxo-dGTP pyrophosphatase MutT (NUDIX family)